MGIERRARISANFNHYTCHSETARHQRKGGGNSAQLCTLSRCLHDGNVSFDDNPKIRHEDQILTHVVAVRQTHSANAQQYDLEVIAKRTKRHLDELEVRHLGIVERSELIDRYHSDLTTLNPRQPLDMAPTTRKRPQVDAPPRGVPGRQFLTSEMQTKERKRSRP